MTDSARMNAPRRSISGLVDRCVVVIVALSSVRFSGDACLFLAAAIIIVTSVIRVVFQAALQYCFTVWCESKLRMVWHVSFCIVQRLTLPFCEGLGGAVGRCWLPASGANGCCLVSQYGTASTLRGG